MSSVAYPTYPTEPGWWGTAWLMFLGWLTAAVVLGGLYLAGSLAGAIGRNTSAVGPSGMHAINDWPFAESGTWSLLADVSVFALALVITTIAIAWQLRGPFAAVSEARLLVVLLFSSGAPFVTSERSAPLYFVIAVWVVRAWVVKDELRFPRRPLVVTGVVLALTVASYGLVHPVWIESATTVTPVTKSPTVMVLLHNQGRVGVEVESVSGGPPGAARVGPWWREGARLPVRIGPGHTQVFTLKLTGACGGLFGSIRYRVFGMTRSEPLRATPAGFPSC